MSMATTAPILTVFPRRTLFMIGGNPAIGKTLVGQKLAKLTSFPLLDKEALLSPFVEQILEKENSYGRTSREHEKLANSFKEPVYSSLLNLAHETVLYGAGGSITVSSFSRYFKEDALAVSPFDGANPLLTDVRRKAEKANYRVFAVWLHLSDKEEHRRRMETRAWHLDENKLEDFDNWLAGEPTPDKVVKNANLIVDIVGKDPVSVAREIIKSAKMAR